jgi:anti-sigma B factor antagonist
MDLEFTVDDQQTLLIDVECGGDHEPPRMVVFGEVDAATADQLQNAVIDVLRRHRPPRIDMDVRGITFLGAAGISALVQCQADARQLECRIRLIGTPPVVYRVLQITGLLEHFGVPGPAPVRRVPDNPDRGGGAPGDLSFVWPAVSDLIRGGSRYPADLQA